MRFIVPCVGRTHWSHARVEGAGEASPCSSCLLQASRRKKKQKQSTNRRHEGAFKTHTHSIPNQPESNEVKEKQKQPHTASHRPPTKYEHEILIEFNCKNVLLSVCCTVILFDSDVEQGGG